MRQTESETDRAVRQTESERGSETDRVKEAVRQADREKDRAVGQTDRVKEAVRQTDRVSQRQRVRQTE